MKNYMGFKLIKAEPMTRGEYNKFRGWQIPADECPDDAGYKVVYSDDYVSWSPADVFEKAYMEVTGNDALKSKVSISQQMVDDFIKGVKIQTIGDKTTLVHVTLANGFTITEASSCVDPENYSVEIGAEICMERIKNKVWELLGFLLQTAVNGVK